MTGLKALATGKLLNLFGYNHNYKTPMGKFILHSTNNNWASKHSTNSTTKHIMLFQTKISFKLVVIKWTAMLLAVEVAKSTMLMQEQVVALFAEVALEAVQF